MNTRIGKPRIRKTFARVVFEFKINIILCSNIVIHLERDCNLIIIVYLFVFYEILFCWAHAQKHYVHYINEL